VLAPASAGAAPTWRLEQPAPPPGAPFKVPLGPPGDLKFFSANRGVLSIEGNDSIPRGLYTYDGVEWRPLATVCGGSGDTAASETAAETEEETGLSVEIVRLVGVYSDPDRDPRGHNVSCAYLARVREGEPEAASDATEVAFLDPSTVDLAFDHEKIVADALSGGAPPTY